MGNNELDMLPLFLVFDTMDLAQLHGNTALVNSIKMHLAGRQGRIQQAVQELKVKYEHSMEVPVAEQNLKTELELKDIFAMLIKQRQHGVIRLPVESSQSASFSDPPLHSEISSLDEVMHNMREYLLRRQLSPGSTPTATTSTPPPPPPPPPPPSPPVIVCLDKNTSCS